MVHHVFSRAQVDNGAMSVWNHGQEATVPASAAHSTFSLSTPMTGTMDKKQEITTPTTTDREAQHSMNGGSENGEIDDLTHAASIPLPPDEDEGGEEHPRFAPSLLRERCCLIIDGQVGDTP